MMKSQTDWLGCKEADYFQSCSPLHCDTGTKSAHPMAYGSPSKVPLPVTKCTIDQNWSTSQGLVVPVKLVVTGIQGEQGRQLHRTKCGSHTNLSHI